MSTATYNGRRVKAAEFLWVMQTALLRLAADVLKTDRTDGFKKADQYSGTGLFIRMDEAVRAACLIPADMDAVQAAGGLRTPAPGPVAASSWAGIRKPSQ
jgi:hypothetical protein